MPTRCKEPRKKHALHVRNKNSYSRNVVTSESRRNTIRKDATNATNSKVLEQKNSISELQTDDKPSQTKQEVPVIDENSSLSNAVSDTKSRCAGNSSIFNCGNTINNKSLSKLNTVFGSKNAASQVKGTVSPTNAITLAGYCVVCWKKARYFCSNCKFVGYCCFAHMAKHWAEHLPLCIVVKSHCARSEGFLYGRNKANDADQWRYKRVQFLEQVRHILQRNVLPYERDLILFPKYCSNCYETKCDDLVSCKYCQQVWYCRNHPNHFPKNHSSWCSELQLFSSLAQKQAQGNLYMFDMNFGKIPTNSSILARCTDIKSVLCDVLQYVCEPDDLSECEMAMLAQAVSGPLTVLYAINILKYEVKKTFVLHLIGAELHYEGRILHAWEHFFLHLLPDKLQHLKIVMVGPELNATQPIDKLILCEDCQRKNKTCVFEYKDGLLYHEYFSKKNFITPTLVCAFNPGLHRVTGFQQTDTWPLSIKAALDNGCPFLFTAYTAHEAPLDLQRVMQQTSVRVLHPPTCNPFASLKPDRNFISDHEAPLIFKNYYMTIVIRD